ncbi:hypothetical protein ABWH89_09540 [Hoeflea alexandrii]|uniref:hypothetical protein n=1 Tax=Hoeflea alexandrii TaxID=288436 RepID=UPI0035CF1FA1
MKENMKNLKSFDFGKWYLRISSAIGTLAACVTVYAVLFPESVSALLNDIRGNTSEIADSVAKLDPEVSDDPVIQIRKRGYDVNSTGLTIALGNNDAVTVNLFCLSPLKFDVAWSRLFTKEFGVSESVEQVIVNCPKYSVGSACENFIEEAPNNFYRAWTKYEDEILLDKVQTYCGLHASEKFIAAVKTLKTENAKWCEKTLAEGNDYFLKSFQYRNSCG